MRKGVKPSKVLFQHVLFSENIPPRGNFDPDPHPGRFSILQCFPFCYFFLKNFLLLFNTSTFFFHFAVFLKTFFPLFNNSMFFHFAVF